MGALFLSMPPLCFFYFTFPSVTTHPAVTSMRSICSRALSSGPWGIHLPFADYVLKKNYTITKLQEMGAKGKVLDGVIKARLRVLANCNREGGRVAAFSSCAVLLLYSYGYYSLFYPLLRVLPLFPPDRAGALTKSPCCGSGTVTSFPHPGHRYNPFSSSTAENLRPISTPVLGIFATIRSPSPVTSSSRPQRKHERSSLSWQKSPCRLCCSLICSISLARARIFGNVFVFFID